MFSYKTVQAVLTATLWVVVSPNVVRGQCETVKLTPCDLVCGFSVGSGFAFDGETIYDVVLSPEFIYRLRRDGTTWVSDEKITLSPAGGLRGGLSVSGDRLIVGARAPGAAPTSPGRAYVFQRNDGGTPSDPSDDSWSLDLGGELASPDPATENNFGNPVFIDGDRAIVGAPQLNADCSATEAAYVFRRDPAGWVLEATLDEQPGACVFAESVVVKGTRAYVGAPRDFQAGFWAGAVYVYRRDGTSWTLEQKLTALDAGEAQDGGGFFGTAISVSGDRLGVGAPFYPSTMGSAYIFRRVGTTWTNEGGRLQASDGAFLDEFGNNAAGVALEGDVFVVGAHQHTHPGFPANSGAAYVFRRNGPVWTQDAELLQGDPGSLVDDSFGTTVRISGDLVVVGAPGDEDPCSQGQFCSTGSFYVYSLSGTQCNDTPFICPDCNGNGIPDQCDEEDVCDDGCDCTDDSCEAGTCVHDSNCPDDPGPQACDVLPCKCVPNCTVTPCPEGEFCCPATEVCGECLHDDHCPDSTPKCDLDLCACKECLVDADCDDGDPCAEDYCDDNGVCQVRDAIICPRPKQCCGDGSCGECCGDEDCGGERCCPDDGACHECCGPEDCTPPDTCINGICCNPENGSCCPDDACRVWQLFVASGGEAVPPLVPLATLS